MYLDSSKIMPGGQSHNARFFDPYPFYASRARGKYIWDVDGNRYTDYWMGHTALICGHSPPFVVRALKKQVSNGLLYGTPNRHAHELAKLVNETVPCAESVRFCSTGAEATMYAVRLARGYTKRKTIVKIAGGWHGYNSTLAVGVTQPYSVPEHMQRAFSEYVPPPIQTLSVFDFCVMTFARSKISDLPTIAETGSPPPRIFPSVGRKRSRLRLHSGNIRIWHIDLCSFQEGPSEEWN